MSSQETLNTRKAMTTATTFEQSYLNSLISKHTGFTSLSEMLEAHTANGYRPHFAGLGFDKRNTRHEKQQILDAFADAIGE